jgi:hypothetical protein
MLSLRANPAGLAPVARAVKSISRGQPLMLNGVSTDRGGGGA